MISLAAGAAMAVADPRASGRDVRCKWPNDLLVGDSKVGGILGEVVVTTGIGHVVVGIGVNLDPPVTSRVPARSETSMRRGS